MKEEDFAKNAGHLRRFGMPHEVAQGCLFLCSDAASFVAGTCLVMDGGFTAM